MAKRYVWIGSGCARINGDRYLSEGDFVPADSGMSEAELKGLEKKGLVKVYEGDLAVRPMPLKSTEDARSTVPMPDPEADESPRWPTNWGFTPEMLEKTGAKTLADLNNLIADHAARLKVVQPDLMNTVEEAQAFLASDL
jgi:hypothetical protein